VAMQMKANQNSASYATSKTSLDAYIFKSYTDDKKTLSTTRNLLD